MKKNTILAVSLISAAVLFTTGCNKKDASASAAPAAKITGVADLEGKKIGVQAGTTGEAYSQESIKDARVSSFKTAIDASLALKNGAIDAIVIDELPAKEIVKRNADLEIVYDDFSSEEYAIAVRKGNTELLATVNATIAQLKADGTYDSLLANFMPVEGEITIPAIEATGTEGVLKMGTNASFPPFEYVEGTDVVGFDPAMAQYIANAAGAKLEIVDMAFDGLIAALQANAIDFIAAGMTATEERRQNVDFSEPYYQTKQVIVIKK